MNDNALTRVEDVYIDSLIDAIRHSGRDRSPAPILVELWLKQLWEAICNPAQRMLERIKQGSKETSALYQQHVDSRMTEEEQAADRSPPSP